MSLVLADRVQQTATAVGTTAFTLTGTVTGFQSFAVIGNGNTTYCSAFDSSGNWEVSICSYSTTGPTLTRTTILSSSNSGSAVTFSGTVAVILTYPSSKSINQDASGNVGIGTSSPATKLQVVGEIRSSSDISNSSDTIVYSYNGAAAGTVQAGIQFVGSGQNTRFYTASTERMRIDSSGNVGIGTSSPSAKLSISDATAPKLNLITSGGGERAFINYTESTSLMRIDSDGAIVLATNNTEAARIDSSGNLFIATTGLATVSRLALKYAGGGTQYGFGLQPVADTTTAIYFNNAAGTVIGSISQTASVTTYNVTSDYRLKENVAPMTGALDTIAKLKPVTYTWKESGENGQGFIAHELQEVVPDCVTGEKDAMRMQQYEISPAIPAEIDSDGKVIKEAVEAVMGEREVPAYQGIDTSFLVATLTAAIQEQQAMIKNLTTRLTALENK